MERYSRNLLDLASEFADVCFSGSTPFLASPHNTVFSPLVYDYIMPLKFLRERFDLVHVIDVMAMAFWPTIRALARKTVISVLNVSPVGERLGDIGFLQHTRLKLFKAGLENSVKHADRLLVLSDLTRQKLRELYGCDSEVFTSYISADFKPMRREKFRHGIHLGCVGKANEAKRFDKAIRILPYLDDARLTICGDGTETEKLKKLAEYLGVRQSVDFMGDVPPEEMPGMYNDFDVMLYPCRYGEFGYPVIEAERCGIPVILWTDAIAPVEVRRHALQANDERHAAKLVESLRDDDRLYESLVSQGLESSRNYGRQEMARRLKGIYETLK